MFTRRTFVSLGAGLALPTSLVHAADTPPPSTSPVPQPSSPFLRGGFAPVIDEVDLPALKIRGRIPDVLRGGCYLRNGPNPQFDTTGYMYPFDGDGMVHALAFGQDGTAHYRNRWVLTQGLTAERRAGRALYGNLRAPRRPDPALLLPGDEPGPLRNLANTNVVRHGGKIMALWEGGDAYELNADLSTRGPLRYNGLPRMTAHPRVDPKTGELITFNYTPGDTKLGIAIVHRNGQVTQTRQVDIGRSLMVHDFAITDRHLVFIGGPVVMDISPEALRTGRFITWQPNLGTRIALVERNGTGVQLIDVDPFFTFHLLNAYEEDSSTIVDFVRYAGFGQGGARLERATIKQGSAAFQTLDERVCEFPRIDPRTVGQTTRHAWLCVRVAASSPSLDGIGHWNARTGVMARRSFGIGTQVDEPVFVADPARGAEAGWLMVWVWDGATDTSRLVVLDALNINAEPVAEVPLSRRVPHGLHGDWMPGLELL